MITTPKGNISVKPKPGRNWRSYQRMQTVARLEATGLYSNTQIAQFINVTLAGLNTIKARPDYLVIRASLASGIIDHIQQEIMDNNDALITELRDLVPNSLRVLRDNLVRGAADTATLAERKLAVSIGQEVLDREGTLAKVSRTQIDVKERANFDEQDRVASELKDLLAAAESARGGDNRELDKFVQTAGDTEAKTRMAQLVNLDDFSSDRVQ